MARKLSFLLLISLLLSHFPSCRIIIFYVSIVLRCKPHKIKCVFCITCGNTFLKTNQEQSSPPMLGQLQKPLAHQSGYIRVFWELVKFTFNIRISKVLAALWPWLLTRQSLFVPPDVFRALSQQFLLRCIRTYIQCGTWSPAKPAPLKVVACKKYPSGLIYFNIKEGTIL